MKTHFVALAESLSCLRVRIWMKQTQPKTRGGRQKRGWFGKRKECEILSCKTDDDIQLIK